jgi:hypothetical protein
MFFCGHSDDCTWVLNPTVYATRCATTLQAGWPQVYLHMFINYYCIIILLIESTKPWRKKDTIGIKKYKIPFG